MTDTYRKGSDMSDILDLIGGVILDDSAANKQHARNAAIFADTELPPSVRAVYGGLMALYGNRSARVSKVLYTTHFTEGLYILSRWVDASAAGKTEQAAAYCAWLCHGAYQVSKEYIVLDEERELRKLFTDVVFRHCSYETTPCAGPIAYSTTLPTHINRLASSYAEIARLFLPRHIDHGSDYVPALNLDDAITATYAGPYPQAIRDMLVADKIQNFIGFRRTMAQDPKAYTAPHADVLKRYFIAWLNILEVSWSDFISYETRLNSYGTL